MTTDSAKNTFNQRISGVSCARGRKVIRRNCPGIRVAVGPPSTRVLNSCYTSSWGYRVEIQDLRSPLESRSQQKSTETSTSAEYCTPEEKLHSRGEFALQRRPSRKNQEGRPVDNQRKIERNPENQPRAISTEEKSQAATKIRSSNEKLGSNFVPVCEMRRRNRRFGTVQGGIACLRSDRCARMIRLVGRKSSKK